MSDVKLRPPPGLPGSADRPGSVEYLVDTAKATGVVPQKLAAISGLMGFPDLVDAVSGLIRSGITFNTAVDQLRTTDDERRRLLANSAVVEAIRYGQEMRRSLIVDDLLGQVPDLVLELMDLATAEDTGNDAKIKAIALLLKTARMDGTASKADTNVLVNVWGSETSRNFKERLDARRNAGWQRIDGTVGRPDDADGND